MRKCHRNSAGFTLIELMVSLAILMILIFIGISSYERIFSQQELIQRTARLYHFLRLANSQSIKLNKKVYVRFCQLGNTGVWKMAMADQSSCDCFVASSCLINGLEKIEDLADGEVIFTSPSEVKFSGKQVSYSPIRFRVNPGSITLRNKNGASLKVIQSRMRLKICSPDEDQLGHNKC